MPAAAPRVRCVAIGDARPVSLLPVLPTRVARPLVGALEGLAVTAAREAAPAP